MASIVMKNVKKSYGPVDVIKGVDLEIEKGEFMVFVGPSGSGKSTLLRLVSGLEDITDGEMYFDDQFVNDKTPKDRGIAMVFQSYALYPHMTVRENMSFGLKLDKANKEETEKRVNDAAKLLQIDHLLDRLPKEMSGGQRQRVAIGRAITRNPRVFLFDEPLSNLDAALRVDTRLEIAKLHHDMGGVTMIYVTHDQVEAMTLADRICVLADGKVMQVGTPQELYDHPNSIFVAGFIGSPKMNFLQGRIAEEENCHTLGIRPEHLAIKDDGRWKGKVTHTENLGSDNFIFLSVDGGQRVIVRVEGAVKHAQGTEIAVSPIDDVKIHRFDKNDKPI